MSKWTVEFERDFLDLVQQWSVARQKELDAIQHILADDGPEGLGGYAMELEGVPSWENLNGPVSLMLPIPIKTGYRLLRLEVQPGFKVVILDLA